MKRKFQQWWSLQRAKNPGNMVLCVILLFNVVFFLFSASVISALDLDGTESMGFMEAAFCTLTMILDAGCIQFVISDIGKAGVFVSLFCLAVVVVGMISFTGAVIGYFTNYISHFIEKAHEGRTKVVLTDHVVILNWNSRASEIINDYLYSTEHHNVVVLVNARKEEVQREIDERIANTLARENRKLEREYAHLGFFARAWKLRKLWHRRNVTVLVREGDIFSAKQLRDISLEHARTIIILGSDTSKSGCKYENREWQERNDRGNSQTVKTLMQVVELTASDEVDENQKIVVEITDQWTWKLVNRIIQSKHSAGRRDIIPVRVNHVLGQLLSQFSLMPELNTAYGELFSNRGTEFYSVKQDVEDLRQYFHRYLFNHRHAIPLTAREYKGETYCYYAAGCGPDLERLSDSGIRTTLSVSLNENYRMPSKNVIILGHNSKSRDIMQGFQSFCEEWSRDDELILSVLVIDDKKHLDKMDHYRDYPFVIGTVEADIYDEELTCATIEQYITAATRQTSVLILSDDQTADDDVDAGALANLIYVQNILTRKQEENDPVVDLIDVIVEIVDPKHHDIVNSYSVNNVVISNRYISKMIAQIGEVDALFDFYEDVLSYDDGKETSKEIYIKAAGDYFNQLPGKTTAEQLIRAVFEATTDPAVPEEEWNMTALLGYFDTEGKMHIFSGDQSAIQVELKAEDKLILFADH